MLTLALEKPEHPGRVRGVGGNVKPAAYFNLPPRQRQSVEETIRKNVQKILEEEREKIIAQERAIWMERLMRLEAKIDGKSLPDDAPKPATPKNEHVSGQGSCSKQGLKAENGVENEVETAKKILDLRDDENMGMEEKVKETDGEKNVVPIVDVGSIEVISHGNECKLAVGPMDNIVAIGTFVEVVIESSKQTIHGISLGEENARVSIIRTIVDDAKLPFPINDEIITVRDAIGTCVAWPKNPIVPPPTAQKVIFSCNLVSLFNMHICYYEIILVWLTI